MAKKSAERMKTDGESPKSLLNPEFDKDIEKHTGYEIKPPEGILDICKDVREAGGVALLVGGVVRDAVINKEYRANIEHKDFDIEVYGITAEELKGVLEARFGPVKLEGESFAVFKARVPGCKLPVDVSLPRKDYATGEGTHRGFEIEWDPSFTFKEASRRRDLTIGSLGYNPLEGAVYDAWGGVNDIKHGEIRAVDPKTFVEDPLRVLRVMQFAARFSDFEVEQATVDLCRQVVEDGLVDKEPRERISEEWEKMLLKGEKPSKGLRFAKEAGLLKRYWPDLEKLDQIPQGKKYHPEGDVWTHTLQTVDAAAEIIREIEDEDLLCERDLRVIKENAESKGELAYKEELARGMEVLLREKLKAGWRLEEGAALIKGGVIADEIIAVAVEAGEKVRLGEIARWKRRAREATGKEPEKVSHDVLNAAKEKGRFVEAEEKLRLLGEHIDRLVEHSILTPADLEGIKEAAETAGADAEERAKKEGTASRLRELKLALLLGALLHDLGKIEKTQILEGGKITSKGHSEAGVKMAEEFLGNFTFPDTVKKMAIALVRDHMTPVDLWKQGGGVRGVVNRLVESGATPYLLALAAEADQRGRSPDGDTPLAAKDVDDLEDWRGWFLDRAAGVKLRGKRVAGPVAPSELMTALERKKGGVDIGAVLDAVHSAVLRGEVSGDDALAYATKLHAEWTEELGDPGENEGNYQKWVDRRNDAAAELRQQLEGA